MNDKVTINGSIVNVIVRERSSHAGDSYAIESFVLSGIHNDLRIGMSVEISFPEEVFRGRVTSVWADSAKNVTHLRVYLQTAPGDSSRELI